MAHILIGRYRSLTEAEARFCRKFSFEVICSMISPYDQR